MFVFQGRPLSPDQAFTDPETEIQYPANWLRLSSPEEREEIGITEVPDPPYYDQRFFWGPDLPKDHDQLIEQWTGQTRTTAGTLLAPTDWMIIRELDNGTEMPADTKTLREEIRLACNEKIASIAETDDTPALAAYITGPDYPTWPPYVAPAADDTAGDAPVDGVEPVGDSGES
jgi:hypothetical protein